MHHQFTCCVLSSCALPVFKFVCLGYRRYNTAVIESGKSKGHFVVDLCRPGHMTACLTTFQEAISCTIDNWDAAFQDNWVSADMVDCILSYAATAIMGKLKANTDEGRQMLDVLRHDSRAAQQFLLLAHLYARTDTYALSWLRSSLLKSRWVCWMDVFCTSHSRASTVVAMYVANYQQPSGDAGLEAPCGCGRNACPASHLGSL